jgi:hypothetical protein
MDNQTLSEEISKLVKTTNSAFAARGSQMENPRFIYQGFMYGYHEINNITTKEQAAQKCVAEGATVFQPETNEVFVGLLHRIRQHLERTDNRSQQGWEEDTNFIIEGSAFIFPLTFTFKDGLLTKLTAKARSVELDISIFDTKPAEGSIMFTIIHTSEKDLIGGLTPDKLELSRAENTGGLNLLCRTPLHKEATGTNSLHAFQELNEPCLQLARNLSTLVTALLTPAPNQTETPRGCFEASIKLQPLGQTKLFNRFIQPEARKTYKEDLYAICNNVDFFTVLLQTLVARKKTEGALLIINKPAALAEALHHLSHNPHALAFMLGIILVALAIMVSHCLWAQSRVNRHWTKRIERERRWRRATSMMLQTFNQSQGTQQEPRFEMEMADLLPLKR